MPRHPFQRRTGMVRTRNVLVSQLAFEALASALRGMFVSPISTTYITPRFVAPLNNAGLCTIGGAVVEALAQAVREHPLAPHLKRLAKVTTNRAWPTQPSITRNEKFTAIVDTILNNANEGAALITSELVEELALMRERHTKIRNEIAALGVRKPQDINLFHNGTYIALTSVLHPAFNVTVIRRSRESGDVRHWDTAYFGHGISRVEAMRAEIIARGTELAALQPTGV